MIQVIERRRDDRRLTERRRSPYRHDTYPVGIYRCDSCDYDAASRIDDIKHHSNFLLHSILRIFHQIIDYAAEAISRLTVATINVSTAARTSGEKNSRVHHSQAAGLSANGLNALFRFLAKLDWKECIYENLYIASQALALVAALAGGIVFAGTALVFAIFPGNSQTGDFHEAMEREYRRKAEAERKRRKREDEELQSYESSNYKS